MQNAGTVDCHKISSLTLKKTVFFYLSFPKSLLFQMPVKNKAPTNNKSKTKLQIPSPNLISQSCKLSNEEAIYGLLCQLST